MVAGQRLMQTSSDIFLGWHRGLGADGVPRDFYLRQLRDGKGGRARAMVPTACRRTGGLRLDARACARPQRRPLAIASYLGSSNAFDRAVVEFSEAYADQNERDYKELADAVKAGRVVAQTGL